MGIEFYQYSKENYNDSDDMKLYDHIWLLLSGSSNYKRRNFMGDPCIIKALA